MKTWHIEMAVAALVLVAVALLSDGSWLELLGAAAVVLTFGHAQVAERLAETEAARLARYRAEVAGGHGVECYRWATRYLIGKEVLWLVYFVLHASWSALAGVVLFLAYPLWRRFWRRRHPR